MNTMQGQVAGDRGADAASGPDLGADQWRAALERMLLIRRIEERLGEEFSAGNLPGGVHLYIGQEAVAVGVCMHLADTDWIASTHRGHGHYLAKGGAPAAMVAEIYGRAQGICRGMGGSMHVADVSKGILGANGIVGAGISIATGAALTARFHRSNAVSVCFFGDGAAGQGVLTEALNLAALWKLPLILVCENNGYSEYTAGATVTAGAIADRAGPYGVSGVTVDGNRFQDVWSAAGAAVARARRGDGPTLIEARTYRLRGHIEAEKAFLQGGSYRTDAEIEEWKLRDPLDRCAADMKSAGLLTEVGRADVERKVRAIVDSAFAFAQQADLPDPSQVGGMMFCEQPA